MAPCKVNYDPTTAKEMLLMANSLEEQQQWVSRMLKRIQKSGYKAAGGGGAADISFGGGGGSAKVSPQESMRSNLKPSGLHQQKSSTLPAHTASSASTGSAKRA